MTEPSPEQQSGSSGAVVIAVAASLGFTALALAERRNPTADSLLDRANDRFVLPAAPLLNCSQGTALRGSGSSRMHPFTCWPRRWPGCGIGGAIEYSRLLPAPEQGRELSFSNWGSPPAAVRPASGALGWRTTAIGFRTLGRWSSTYRAW